MIEKIDLSGSWQAEDSEGMSFAGTVPGCVHTDLFSRDELFYEMNSEKTRFIESRDYTYKREFTVREVKEGAVLVFEGLDTYADVYLNGLFVGHSENMFIPHRFSVDGILREGVNTLEVRFTSPVKAVEGRPPLIGCFTTERLYTRRMQCTYGWDWVDRFVTMGIFRPVYILFENEMTLRDVYVFTSSIDEYSAQIKISEHFDRYSAGSLVVSEILDPEGDVIWRSESWCEEGESVLYADIRGPKLWYPHNYGAQPLYTLRVTVGDNVMNQPFGIRTVKILQLEDNDPETIKRCEWLKETDSGLAYDQNEKYSCFILLVNGVRIYCTGANWVPCEPFPSFESEEKITSLLESTVKAGMNMIRVWGGGIFECEHFYNECDRLGILVTQDFLMACGRYPEREEYFREELKAEAELAAVYLRNHPSLMWWSGDNENAVNGNDAMESYPGRISARSVIAPVLERLDYNRPFLFSSPYGGKKYASKTVGTTHNTQFMGYFFNYVYKGNIDDYREWWESTSARFIAEEPNMGAVCQRSLDEFIARENQDRRDMWLYHTKTNKGLGKELMDITAEFARGLFGDFGDFEDRYFKLRYVQYEWVRVSLGNSRSKAWFNSGIIYWMLNDCWPAAVGWSMLDYYTRPKCGFYSLKKFGGDMNVYITKAEEGFRVHVSNIIKEPRDVSLRIGVLDLDTNTMRDSSTVNLRAECGAYTECVDLTLGEREVLIAEITDGMSPIRAWYKHGAPTLHKADSLRYKVDGDKLTVTSDSYVHAVEIECGEILEDNYFSLLPGEERVIDVSAIGDKAGIILRAFTL